MDSQTQAGCVEKLNQQYNIRVSDKYKRKALRLKQLGKGKELTDIMREEFYRVVDQLTTFEFTGTSKSR
jgi:hypothetical protein